MRFSVVPKHGHHTQLKKKVQGKPAVKFEAARKTTTITDDRPVPNIKIFYANNSTCFSLLVSSLGCGSEKYAADNTHFQRRNKLPCLEVPAGNKCAPLQASPYDIGCDADDGRVDLSQTAWALEAEIKTKSHKDVVALHEEVGRTLSFDLQKRLRMSMQYQEVLKHMSEVCTLQTTIFRIVL